MAEDAQQRPRLLPKVSPQMRERLKTSGRFAGLTIGGVALLAGVLIGLPVACAALPSIAGAAGNILGAGWSWLWNWQHFLGLVGAFTGLMVGVNVESEIGTPDQRRANERAYLTRTAVVSLAIAGALWFAASHTTGGFEGFYSAAQSFFEWGGAVVGAFAAVRQGAAFIQQRRDGRAQRLL